MPNVRLVVEYNGSEFHGWQKQPRLRTIQGELQSVLQTVLREEIPYVNASGRTDAGVHAQGQVVNFPCQSVPDLHRLKHSISNIMKGELSVVRAEVVSDQFHATRDARRKQYSYTILHRDAPAVLDAGRVWHVAGPLNIEAMREAVGVLVGTHDFSSFQAAGCNSRSSVKEIFESEFTFDDPYLVYRVIGSGFLKQMVRTIVGTAVEIGKGTLGSMQAILEARDRTRAGITAPAHGLCLDWVDY